MYWIFFKHINIFVTFFLFFCLIYIYIYIFFINIKNLVIIFNIYTKFTKIYRIFLSFFVLLLFFCIFIWRFYRRHNYIVIDIITWKIYILKILKMYEITNFDICLIIILLILLLILYICLLQHIYLYIKAIFYSTHIYLLQKSRYKQILKIYTKLYAIKNTCIAVIYKIIYSCKYPCFKPIKEFLLFIIQKQQYWMRFIISCIIYFLPISLLFYDLYMYLCISKFFYCLPWVYILVLMRMYHNFVFDTYIPTNTQNISDSSKCHFLYITNTSKTIYLLHCKTLLAESTNKCYK